MAVTGPDFISLQVRDIDRAAEFYEQQLGLTRVPGPPHAVVFGTTPAAFAVREAMPGVELSAPGTGIALWMLAPDAPAIHERLIAAGVTITTEPVNGPFGFTFTFADLDGYLVTLHDKA